MRNGSEHCLPSKLVYVRAAAGNTLRSIPTLGSSMYWFRSTHASESQNLPTLSTPNDRKTSGGFPALIAAICCSSVTPHFASTVIHG